ncbi:MAG: VOC family protein [Caldibacillus debilis]|uniref:VOC family protein n=1 Tax=Caldibacillus debilis TaxID=301148 RepID=UPI000E37417B|nr:VOC family protein [Caldibacillus debilis]REJ15090.1 MAG: VOC family protein [Caldibacillus debilis]
MTLVKRIDTVFVPVTDLERSEKWYLDVLTFRSADGNYIGFSFKDRHPLQTGLCIYKTDKIERLGHVAFNFFTEDADGYHRFLPERKVKVTEIHEEGGTRFFEFFDPDGNEPSAVTFPE